ncbi:SMI1/KNR4 family protein [Sphingobacterium bovistauri]|uniref:SMI1/KNR4 family protein n=1 Tax=Sphingobacterium bovistauri TaxID=2781959 RepID=A0ABS7Z506_9SPHI|nr:SMI1/KNR4 family protein [Sphingobacterium bovistauri]MCA5005255.1 SMI1/KNR4 family protein [Sphingobacterium bovistauri]
MKSLNELEKELNISYPEIYKSLYTNGMLDWGTEENGWYTNVFPKLKENPPLLLFGADIEIWDPIDWKGGIEEILNHEVYDIHEKFKLVPFAKNGAGDMYVFQYDLEQNGEIPISFFPHDDDELEVQAKNFQDFIFRQLLESLTEMDEYSMFEGDSEEQIKTHLLNQLRTHQPYLTENQIAVLEEIYKRDLFEYTYKVPNGGEFEAYGLLTFDEVDEIVKREIDFPLLNKKMEYLA